jgi:hypothetical protein
MHLDDSLAPPPIERSGNWVPRLLGALLLVGGVVMLVTYWGSYLAAVKGPRPVTPAQLAAIDDPDEMPDRWVTFQTDQVVNTNISVTEGGRFQRTYYYHLARVGDRWAVVRARERQLGGRIAATAAAFDDEAQQGAAAEARRQKPKGRFLPYQLDTADTPDTAARFGGTITMILFMAGVVLACGLLEQKKPAPDLEDDDEAGAEPTVTGWQWSSR